MAETRCEAREGDCSQARERGEDQVNVKGNADNEIHLARNDPEKRTGGETKGIEMRTGKDAKAVPSSRGGGEGGLEPLEHHLNRDQLANLTLESRRIKVMHTNSIPKLVIISKRSQFKKFLMKRNTKNAK